jgi:hypothetical protein
MGEAKLNVENAAKMAEQMGQIAAFVKPDAIYVNGVHLLTIEGMVRVQLVESIAPGLPLNVRHAFIASAANAVAIGKAIMLTGLQNLPSASPPNSPDEAYEQAFAKASSCGLSGPEADNFAKAAQGAWLSSRMQQGVPTANGADSGAS